MIVKESVLTKYPTATGCGSKSSEHCGNIHIVILTQSREYVSIIPNSNA